MADDNPFPGENNTGHVWDGNLRELRNPPPRWWMLGLWASILFVAGYGILYPFWPTLDGYSKGLLGWTQIEEYQRGVARVEAVRAPFEDRIHGLTAAEILTDPELAQYTVASSKVLFGDNCSACHGSGGQGNPGYPILADDYWQYGGTPAKLVETITGGRQGSMPAHIDLLSAAEIDQLAGFVTALKSGEPGADDAWALFRAKGCVACHGQEADGAVARLPNGEIITVGAPSFRNGIWRFAPGGVDSARYTISYGVNQAGQPKTREAVMPNFGTGGRLGEQEIKKLAVYVHELGGGL
ncbi:cytochrome c oxidase, cbb3-type, subunit III [Thioflavicoccus mobilis 8321]|uniref:Cbb3-type cytochrome c oxidase subunit n=1 Tax=Thioflavicoccus mobilis 8321 TaxID=765912 RepID=L0GXN3_9GAMM|nr:cytochrome-c oxidase, cbb3-type subunit III [Thioflavicoccus mobilis]AGA90135.1 cytochrome c oxidase, cbb3-type, subunit III [Thioflavicoccus mobilis 8321]